MGRRQELAAAVAAEGLRPTMRADMPPDLVRLLMDCWQKNAGDRPSATSVASSLALLVVCPPDPGVSHASTAMGFPLMGCLGSSQGSGVWV